MSEIRAPQKPIPQFTIRWLIGVMTGWAVIFSIVALATRGHVWAMAISIGLGALVLFLFTGALLFILVWFFTAFTSKKYQEEAGQSPPKRFVVPRREGSDYLSDGE